MKQDGEEIDQVCTDPDAVFRTDLKAEIRIINRVYFRNVFFEFFL